MNIEVAIPCFNEQVTIAKVIRDFREALPEAHIVVYDNNSQDATASLASEAGARVVRVSRQGKGYVMQALFASSKADIIVVVDGDDSYEAQDVQLLLDPLIASVADMTIGTRLHTPGREFRHMHRFGNRLLTRTLNTLFRTSFVDILSGYRAFSRQFVETVPLLSEGFEVETELMVQALEQGMTVHEVPIRFRNRPSGSFSKLNSVSDGYRILLTMVTLLRDHRPLYVFSVLAIASASAGAAVWFVGYSQAVPTGPLSVFRSVGALLIELSVGLVLVGLILNTVNTRLREWAALSRRKQR